MTPGPKYNPDTVKTVLNILQKEFETEEVKSRLISTYQEAMDYD